jgi:hypothetical protein
VTTSRRTRAPSCACGLALFSLSTSSLAVPQWNGAVTTGVAGVGDGAAAWEKTQFFGGVRGDVLFLRDGPRAVGVGPSLAIATAGFSDFRAIGGALALVPLGDLWAVGFEPAAYVRVTDGGTFPGLSGRAWFGIQTYNYAASYAPRGGLTVGYAHDLGGSDAHAIVIAAEIDAVVLALPFVLLYESLRARPRE